MRAGRVKSSGWRKRLIPLTADRAMAVLGKAESPVTAAFTLCVCSFTKRKNRRRRRLSKLPKYSPFPANTRDRKLWVYQCGFAGERCGSPVCSECEILQERRSSDLETDFDRPVALSRGC